MHVNAYYMLITIRHNQTKVKHYWTKCILITKATKTHFVLLRGVEWVHGLFLFPLVLGKMKLPYAKLCFLCSLDNLLQKNVIVLFFGNQILKWRSFEKKDYF